MAGALLSFGMLYMLLLPGGGPKGLELLAAPFFAVWMLFASFAVGVLYKNLLADFFSKKKLATFYTRCESY
jgi:hypothetical protein